MCASGIQTADPAKRDLEDGLTRPPPTSASPKHRRSHCDTIHDSANQRVLAFGGVELSAKAGLDIDLFVRDCDGEEAGAQAVKGGTAQDG